MRFRSGDRLGSGGYGEVWDAVVVETGEKVAVKKLKLERTGEPDARKRFEREVRYQQGITHPNVMPVLAHNFEVTPPWYLMPLAETDLVMPVKEALRKGDEDFIESVFTQVLMGMQAAHSKGVIHRDIGPRNILKLIDGRWVVSDFGVGRAIDRTTTTVTHDAGGIGTLDYMAPEQYSDPHTIDRRADIFGLGKLLLYMVTGDVGIAFRPKTIPSHLYGHIIDRATQTDPAHRYQTIDEMLAAFSSARSIKDYESPYKTFVFLREVIRDAAMDQQSVDRLVTLLAAHPDQRDFFLDTIPYLPIDDLVDLRGRGEDSFQDVLSQFDQHVSGGLVFTYCDVVADFYASLVRTFGDLDLFRMVIARLMKMGKAHNRFHVRDVAVGLLAGSQPGERIAAAVEVIQSDPEAAAWTFEFQVPEDLAPAIRKAIDQAKGQGPEQHAAPTWEEGSF